MKLLLAHNYYGSSAPSGENEVFELERDLLLRQGHDVESFERRSDDIYRRGFIGNIGAALVVPWNLRATIELKQKLADFMPDVFHAHNTFPLLSPAVFRAASSHAATVLTLHNYRLFCPAAIPLRNGRTCTDCMDRHSVFPAIRHGCYRGSRLATLPLALSVKLHSAIRTWSDHVDAYIALSEFQRDMIIKAGLPPRLVHVKPNFLPGDPPVVPWSERSPTVVFAGRLTAEKGVSALVDAWVRWGADAPELRILGSGGLESELRRRANGPAASRIQFAGQVAAECARGEIARARLLILPSQCFEGFPMVIREAFAYGTPVAVSDIGALPEIVSHNLNGVVFRPADHIALLAAVKSAWSEPGKLEKLGQAARMTYESRYTESANYRSLIAIYESALRARRSRTKAA